MEKKWRLRNVLTSCVKHQIFQWCGGKITDTLWLTRLRFFRNCSPTQNIILLLSSIFKNHSKANLFIPVLEVASIISYLLIKWVLKEWICSCIEVCLVPLSPGQLLTMQEHSSYPLIRGLLIFFQPETKRRLLVSCLQSRTMKAYFCMCHVRKRTRSR